MANAPSSSAKPAFGRETTDRVEPITFLPLAPEVSEDVRSARAAHEAAGVVCPSGKVLMRRVAVWLGCAAVVVAVGSTPVAFAASPDPDRKQAGTTTRTVADDDHIKQQVDAQREAQDLDTIQESHWPTDKRSLTVMDTDPGQGYADIWKNVIAQWNSSNSGIVLTYAQGSAPCDYNGATIAVCYVNNLPPGVAGRAWNSWGGDRHTIGGYIEMGIGITDPVGRLNTACHELGHELGLGHPADGSAGPCDGKGNVREDEKQQLREIYGHNDGGPPPPPPPPPAAACADGTDNDGDGKTDHPADPGCDSATDTDETDAPAPPPPPPPPPAAACADGTDNDGDGKTDHPADPGCGSATDTDEADPVARPTPACKDGIDNDKDGKTDFPDDPGCKGPFDSSEFGPVSCDDGKDNDEDGKTDFPADPGCDSLTDNVEKDRAPDLAQCEDGLDNDGDGQSDFPADPGCEDATDADETDPTTVTPTDPWEDCALGVFPLICLLPGGGLFGGLFG